MDRLKAVKLAGASLATAATTSFDDVREKMQAFSLPDLNTLKFDIDSSAFKSARQKLASIEANAQTTVVETIEASSAQQITVNIGDEKLIDKVVDGINQVSRLKNRAVINC